MVPLAYTKSLLCDTKDTQAHIARIRATKSLRQVFVSHIDVVFFAVVRSQQVNFLRPSARNVIVFIKCSSFVTHCAPPGEGLYLCSLTILLKACCLSHAVLPRGVNEFLFVYRIPEARWSL